MIIKEKAESLTMAYFVIAKTESKTEQPMFNPFEMVLKNVMENIKTQKEEENSKEKEV